MNKKIIIGLIGDKKLRDKVVRHFQDIGFHKISISKKTEEIARYLLPGKIFPEETVQEIRNKGYSVSKYYWINLVLASVPDNKDLIVIDDLQLNDVIEGVIIPFTVSDEDQQKNSNTINANSLTLDSDIHGKIKKLSMFQKTV